MGAPHITDSKVQNMGVLSALGQVFVLYFVVAIFGPKAPVIGPELSRIFDDWQTCQEHVVIPDCSKDWIRECVTSLTKDDWSYGGQRMPIYNDPKHKYSQTPIFTGCKKLKSITIPGSMEEIPRGAFEDCWNLETVKIGHGVKKIEPLAFANAYSLKKIDIPHSVEHISGIGVFADVGKETTGLNLRGKPYPEDSLNYGEPKVDNPITEIKIPESTKFKGTSEYLKFIRVSSDGKQTSVTEADTSRRRYSDPLAARGIDRRFIPGQ